MSEGDRVVDAFLRSPHRLDAAECHVHGEAICVETSLDRRSQVLVVLDHLDSHRPSVSPLR